jgi:hypothetical protein
MKTIATICAALTFCAPAFAQDAPGQCVLSQKAAKAVAKRIHAEFCTAQGSRTARAWKLNCLMPSGRTRQFSITNTCPVKAAGGTFTIYVVGLGPVTLP